MLTNTHTSDSNLERLKMELKAFSERNKKTAQKINELVKTIKK